MEAKTSEVIMEKPGPQSVTSQTFGAEVLQAKLPVLVSFEAFPSEVKGDYVPPHTYLLAQQGVPIIELAYLEELARDRVYEMVFVLPVASTGDRCRAGARRPGTGAGRRRPAS